jgi:hypothetical protein
MRTPSVKNRPPTVSVASWRTRWPRWRGRRLTSGANWWGERRETNEALVKAQAAQVEANLARAEGNLARERAEQLQERLVALESRVERAEAATVTP